MAGKYSTLGHSGSNEKRALKGQGCENVEGRARASGKARIGI